ncbi:MAG: CocE/NonD family hydrolase [Planctomycetaceae bacterium]
MSEDVPVATDLPFDVTRTPHAWIVLGDGTRLAARLWRPDTRDPVPAILEFLPYRKGDLTAGRDEPIAAWFAGHGYAYARVDIRGTGDSDGVITDEYAPQEQDDALEVIAWLAAQPWCTGAVGMIGISWGGFNGLQVAARRPPALRAVISMCSTDDRYADDVHYKGGCLLAWDALPWHAVMFSKDALPPDPATVGEGWRETWLRRLEETPPFDDAWVGHQRRDAYWRHGSVCEDFGAIEAAVWMVGGWADGYTNAIGRTVAGLSGPRKGLIGPWPHAWPHDADQGPRIGFLQEALRWWDRWLKDAPDAIEEPLLQAWIQEPARPEHLALDRPGRWVAEDAWPPSSVEPLRLHLRADRVLGDAPGDPGALAHTGVQRHGLFAGTWCPYGPAADLPPDQREDDALALTFETPPHGERIELLGHPRVRLRVAADRPNAFVVARLCDVWPDGTSTLLSRGVLNLTHRRSHERPEPLTPGEPVDVDVELDVLGQAIAAGHRLRLAISTTYWPWLWPSPEVATISVVAGPASWLELPLRPLGAPDGPVRSFAPPERATALAGLEIEEADAFHVIERDILTGAITFRMNQDGDVTMRLPDGLVFDERNRDRYVIVEGDPLSASVTAERTLTMSRGDWRARIETTSAMTSDATHFRLQDTLRAFEGDAPIFERTWDREIARDLV